MAETRKATAIAHVVVGPRGKFLGKWPDREAVHAYMKANLSSQGKRTTKITIVEEFLVDKEVTYHESDPMPAHYRFTATTRVRI